MFAEMLRPERRWRRFVWIGLSLVAGGPCAFLTLEMIGIPFAALTLFGLLVVGQRQRILPETLLAFGLSHGAVVTHFATPDLVTALQQNDSGNTAYAVIHLTVAALMILTALLSMVRRWPAMPGRAA